MQPRLTERGLRQESIRVWESSRQFEIPALCVKGLEARVRWYRYISGLGISERLNSVPSRDVVNGKTVNGDLSDMCQMHLGLA